MPTPSHFRWYLLPLGLVWYRTIDHLRVEWTLNPQYAYGWAVPLLCAYLFWQSAAREPARNPQPVVPPETPARPATSARIGKMHDPRGREIQRDPPDSHGPPSVLCHFPPVLNRPAFSTLLLFAVAFFYLPTRLMQEANPEWRLISWALALIAVSLTVALLSSILPSSSVFPGRVGPSSVCIHNSPAPAVFFFLVAVPWPTPIETTVIQALTHANATVTVEFLALLHVPALQVGNLIEVATGTVGVDDACSGIRSFQASLMLSLFFCLLYRFSVTRALLLILTGFFLSFLFNVIRTLLLTCISAGHGAAAIAAWHDPTGVLILLACFIMLWAAAGFLAAWGSTHSGPLSSSSDRSTNPSRDPSPDLSSFVLQTSSHLRSSHLSSFKIHNSSLIPFFLLGWLLLSELATEAWYRCHERHLPPPVTWTITPPPGAPEFRELPFSAEAQRFLRFDEALNAAWHDPDGSKWQLIFLRWKPGKIAAHLAATHTPQTCLPASGRLLISESPPEPLTINGLTLPFRTYTLDDHGIPLHVFYCLWEDRADNTTFKSETLSRQSRLAAVLAGRRHSGQRSLELAVWGLPSAAEAKAAMLLHLEKILRAGTSPPVFPVISCSPPPDFTAAPQRTQSP